MDVKRIWTLRCVLFLVGLVIIALGINFNIMASFGVGGWDAYNIAMVDHFGFTIGFWLNVNASIYILISALLRKKRPKIETFLTSMVLGVFVDGWGLLLQGYHMTSWLTQFLWFLVAILTISLGAGIYLVSKLPPNPIDDLMLAIQERFSCSITIAKFIVEGSGVLFGFLLQGPIGIGTFLMLIIFGPCIQFFYQRVERLYMRMTKTEADA